MVATARVFGTAIRARAPFLLFLATPVAGAESIRAGWCFFCSRLRRREEIWGSIVSIGALYSNVVSCPCPCRKRYSAVQKDLKTPGKL